MSKIVSGSDVGSFADSAKGLAKNPLGIIALFLVLVYGIASLVTIGSNLSSFEKLPLIYFLVVYPILVLFIFTWLVIKHSGKLFAPGDFRDENNYVRMQISAAASLAVASAKGPSTPSKSDIANIVQSVEASAKYKPFRGSGKKCILWVDDRPQNNFYEKQAFEAVGIEVTIAQTTNEGLAYAKQRQFNVIISDMGRKEGDREGYLLLDKLREIGNNTPLFFYASSNQPEHKAETAEHGGQGCTNDPQELFEIVMRAVLES